MLVSAELLEAMAWWGWTVERADGATRVRDDEGRLVGVLDAELFASLVEFLDVEPRAQA
jgi:hypothetical protein